MEEKVKEIIVSAMEVFLRLGFKNVSMDDMAKELRMSKKTLYKYFSDKNDLVKQVIAMGIEMDRCEIQGSITKADNAIEELLGVTEHISVKMKQVHPSIFFELEKYYPESWVLFQEFRELFTCTCMLDNLHRGIKEELYRDNINTEVVARFFIDILDSVFKQSLDVNQQLSFVELHKSAVIYHLYSITNETGKTYLENKIINNSAN
jgi:AcrR family transcriptional regulator